MGKKPKHEPDLQLEVQPCKQEPWVSLLIPSTHFHIEEVTFDPIPHSGGQLSDPGDHLRAALPPPHLPHRPYHHDSHLYLPQQVFRKVQKYNKSTKRTVSCIHWVGILCCSQTSRPPCQRWPSSSPSLSTSHLMSHESWQTDL